MTGLVEPKWYAREPLEGNYFVAAYPPFAAWSAEKVPALEEVLRQPAPSKPLGLYIHLPFCQKKCDYCYYLSYIAQPAAVVDRYLEMVLREMRLYAARPGMKDRPVSFAYFGGGTPSTLTLAQVRRLGEGLQGLLSWDRIEEVTFECAPRSVRPELLDALLEMGVTRLSMGVQSFDNELLKLNGRVHLAEDVQRAYRLLKAAGFEWVNLDLMCGMLGETDEKWAQTVKRMIQLSPDSVTIYQTEIPHNTQLYRDFKVGTLPAEPVPWKVKRARLNHGFRELERSGYKLVSAYNAVKDPVNQRFLYQEYLWRGMDLLGLGVAAFGYLEGVHAQNETTIEAYEEAVARNVLPVKRAYKLSEHDRLVREFVLQLKFGEVRADYFLVRFGVHISELFESVLSEFAGRGWLAYGKEGVRLTREGLLRVDRLLPIFFDECFQEVRYT